MAKASQLLREALTIGQAKGFRRLFLDEGSRMAALLQASLPTFSARALSIFASTLLHSFAPDVTSLLTTPSSTIQIEPLSPQELRVLRLLVSGLSNADIAQELVVSTAAFALLSVFDLQTTGGRTLSPDVPLLLAICLMFQPAVAGVIVFVGSLDRREFAGTLTMAGAL